MAKDECNVIEKCSSSVGKGMLSEFEPQFNMLIELKDAEGNIKKSMKLHNTMTSAGKNGIMDQILAAPTLPKAGWMELGTGSPGATLLGAYLAATRIAFTSLTRLANVVTAVATWGPGVGTGAITEAGIFDVVTQNTVNMWCSASFSVINKGASDSLTITWTITGN